MITGLIFVGLIVLGILFVGLATIFLLILSDFIFEIDIGRRLGKKFNERCSK